MRPASHLCLRECTAVSEDHSVWSLREPSTADTLCFDDENDEQNCILREREKWRTYICTIAAGETASSGWWCAEASPKSRPAQAARRRRLSNAPTLFAHAGGLHDAISSRIGDRPLHAFAKSPMRHLIRASQYRSRPPARAPVVPRILAPLLPTFASRFRPTVVISLSPIPVQGQCHTILRGESECRDLPRASVDLGSQDRLDRAAAVPDAPHAVRASRKPLRAAIR